MTLSIARALSNSRASLRGCVTAKTSLGESCRVDEITVDNFNFGIHSIRHSEADLGTGKIVYEGNAFLGNLSSSISRVPMKGSRNVVNRKCSSEENELLLQHADTKTRFSIYSCSALLRWKDEWKILSSHEKIFQLPSRINFHLKSRLERNFFKANVESFKQITSCCQPDKLN